MVSMSRPRLISVALILVCSSFSLVGSYVTIRAFGATIEHFSLGTVRVSARPALGGRVDVYVPIVDWGVRASPYGAPVALELRFRAIDRDAALASLRSGASEQRDLGKIRSELAKIARKALVRGAIVGILGGMAGGIVGGALIGAVLHRRRWLGYGAATGVVLTMLLASASLASMRQIDYAEFQRPTFYAHGSELPRLLSLSDRLATAGERYTQAYEQVLAGLSRMIVFATGTESSAGSTRTALVGSDLHANLLVLPVLEEYARHKTVFLVGDFALYGTKLESSLAPRISKLGEQVVAVSGNHDSRVLMQALARAGVVVLTRRGRLLADGSVTGESVVEIDGLTVAGYDDPLEQHSAGVRTRSLELTEKELERAVRDFVAWFQALPVRPDVVLVHQHALSHALLDVVGRESKPPIAIFTGHDHDQHLEQRESALLVDGGTVGAGGPFQIAVQAVGFANVQLGVENGIVAVDLIEIEPISGRARATHEVIERR